jgi:micrococcal nuclease
MNDDAPMQAAVEAPDYVYRARVVRIIDGDTVDVDLDLGFGVWLKKQRLRLYGINTPEIRGEERPEGLKAKDFVEEAIGGFEQEVLVQSFKDGKGKYGRWLADVYYRGREQPGAPMVSLNRALVGHGLAKVVAY